MCKSVLTRNLLVLFLWVAMTAGVFGRTQWEGDRLKDSEGSFAAGPPAHCVAAHRVGKIVLAVNNNGTIGTGFTVGAFHDYFTGELVPSCEFPKGSNTEYLFAGALWIGAVIGRDTLVSVGADGWHRYGREMFPDESPFGDVIRRSIIDPTAPEFEGAVSEEDYIAVCTDTLTVGVEPDFFGRPHKPLFIEVTQSSYAWSYACAEDFVLFDYQIKNIGQNTLENVYMGIYVDGDVCFDCAFTMGFTDDITGFVQAVPSSYGGCEFIDSVNLAWIADNDGDLNSFWGQVPHVTGLRLLGTPAAESRVNFNWWASNGSASLDFGPRMRSRPGDPFRDFGTGGLGTPEGDVNKYYIMRHQETDYDQIYTASIQPDDSIWLYPNQTIAGDLTKGFDTRYLLSFGPFDIDPGQNLPISFAYVAGENLHTDRNNIQNLPNDPDQYYANLDFSDLALNARWAAWMYDNPGIDTDGDGYAGEFRVCCDSVSCDTFWYAGDGVPDYRGAVPPSAPTFWLEPQVEALRIRWNGLCSETTPDWFNRRVDFEGYRVYLALDDNPSCYSLVSAYDIDDYLKYTYLDWFGFRVIDYPFTLEELRCLYGSGPDPCNDSTFDPNQYSSPSNPFRHPLFFDSLFYFESVAENPQLGVTTPIRKIYPDAEYPSTLDPNEADPDELTEDGYFKYFEYEMIIENLLPNVLYYINVTAFDFGNPLRRPPLETPVTVGAQSAYVLSATDVGDEYSNNLPKVFALSQNYPNPFNPNTIFEYALPVNCHVDLTIYNILGQKVRALIDQDQEAGYHSVLWNGKNDRGKNVSTGIYLYRLGAGDFVDTRKMLLLK